MGGDNSLNWIRRLDYSVAKSSAILARGPLVTGSREELGITGIGALDLAGSWICFGGRILAELLSKGATGA